MVRNLGDSVYVQGVKRWDSNMCLLNFKVRFYRTVEWVVVELVVFPNVNICIYSEVMMFKMVFNVICVLTQFVFSLLLLN